MRRLPEEHELFNRALADLRSDEHQKIADAYDWNGVKTAVDVGGGAGSLLAAILQKRKDKRRILVEQPEVLPDADRHASEPQILAGKGVLIGPPTVDGGRTARFTTCSESHVKLYLCDRTTLVLLLGVYSRRFFRRPYITSKVGASSLERLTNE